MKGFLLFISALAAMSTMASAQTAGDPANVKFSRVASPVPKQGATGGQQAGEFYHVQYTGAAWGDYNNDGYLDVFYSDRNQHISSTSIQANLYTNTKDGKFARVARSPFAATAKSCPVWADFNNDGLLDMFVSGLSSGTYKWDDERTNLDANVCHLYLNTGIDASGNATYEEVQDCGVRPVFNAMGGKGHMAVAVGDYDKDGYTDLILTGFDEKARPETDKPWDAVRTCYLYRNIKGEKFELVENPLVEGGQFAGLCDGSVTMVDLDGDGWLDIVANGYNVKHESSLHLYYNKCDGTFIEVPTGIRGLTAGITTIADFDNDGRPDLVMGGIYENENRKSMYIAQNMGRRKWQLVEVDTFEGSDGTQISAGDVNQDGLVDLLVGGHGQQHEHTTWVYLNQGNFKFAVNGAHYNDTFGKLGHFNRVTHGSQHFIDYDNDGYLDVWSSGWSNGTCSSGCLTELYRNTSSTKGVPANAQADAPASLSATIDDNGLATFTWTAPSDDFTPEKGLRYNFYIKRKGSDKTFVVLPADLNTGFVRVGNTVGAIYGCSYSIKIPENGTYEWGVQAVDNGNRGGKWASATSDFSTIGIDDVKTTATTCRAWACNGALHYTIDATSAISLYHMDGSLAMQFSATESGSVAIDARGAYIVVVKNQNDTYTTKLVF